ncbi:hypothetical protein J0S82_019780, partial [Galemys pyrenaicus]
MKSPTPVSRYRYDQRPTDHLEPSDYPSLDSSPEKHLGLCAYGHRKTCSKLSRFSENTSTIDRQTRLARRSWLTTLRPIGLRPRKPTG